VAPNITFYFSSIAEGSGSVVFEKDAENIMDGEKE